MPRVKITNGNAKEVIVRGDNVTIVPSEEESFARISLQTLSSVKLTGGGLFVVNGGPPPQEDPNFPISVNDPLFPGWRIEEYNCASGVCASLPGTTTYVEIINALPSDWVDAYLVVEMEHAGASTELLFRVVSATLVDSEGLSGFTIQNMGYAISGGAVTTSTGAYYLQLATTDADGVRIMTSQMRMPSWMSDVGITDQTSIESLTSPLTTTSLVRLDGVVIPDDFYNMLDPSVPARGSQFCYTLSAS